MPPLPDGVLDPRLARPRVSYAEDGFLYATELLVATDDVA
jgi:hypothetical protein